MEYNQSNNGDKAREVLRQLGEFKKLKYIEPDVVGEMHRLYKEDKGGKGAKADKVDKGSAWIRLYPDDLVKILGFKGLTSIKFIIAADLKKQSHAKKNLPTIVVQLQIDLGNELLPNYVYLHFEPASEEDTCPLPEDCSLYDRL